MQVESAVAVVERYARAERLLPERVALLIVGGEIAPTFIAGTDRFWFLETTSGGHRFYAVDPAEQRKAPAFDHEQLASSLAEASGQPWDAEQLPFGQLDFGADGSVFFAAHGRQWRYDGERCADVGDAEVWATWAMSPDGRWAVKRDGYDVALVEVSTGRELRLTNDGTRDRRYGTHCDWWAFRVERRGGSALSRWSSEPGL